MNGPHAMYPLRGGTTGLRIFAFAVSVALIAAVVYVVVEKAACGPSGPLTEVRGIIGTEKEAFFDDKRVQARFACAGLNVTVDTAGSREMLDRLAMPDRDGYGFAFPGSTSTATKITKDLRINERYALFSSPMAVATFRPIVDVLRQAKIVRLASTGGTQEVVDIAKLIEAAREGTKWDKLPGNIDYPKVVLLSTTDPQDSNSAIMFLSIASYVANDFTVVTTSEEVQRVLPDLCRLFAYQGDKPESSQVLFNYYLTGGMGRTPLALIYEAQFATRVGQPVLPPGAELLYPSPSVWARHTLVPLDGGAGRRVGKALEDDLELVRLADEHGFRREGRTDLPMNRRPVPIDTVEPPMFEILEELITGLAPGQSCGVR